MDQEIPVGALAALLGGKLSDPAAAETIVRGVKPLDQAGPHDLAFLWDPKYLEAARASQAGVVIAQEPIPGAQAPVLVVGDAQGAMLTLLGEVYSQRHPEPAPGVHPNASVDPSATLGEGVSVGAGAVVDAGAVLGEGTRVMPLAYVGRGVTTGKGCVIQPHATILDHCVLGNRVTVWSGAVVGKDGFGFLQRDGRHIRIPQIGGVRLDDYVEVGALTTVARGALEDTHLGVGVKIDDHCHVAHGCQLDENVMLIGFSRMGGSAKIGRDTYLLQDAAVGQARTVGKNAIVGSAAKVLYKDVPDGGRVMDIASGAVPHVRAKRVQLCLQQLPELRTRVRKLEKQLTELREQD
ncbi:MAG: UDP-3-O-(3-hydroxymyristoyl)glucosamine N-acyltransferase [Planctomycetes bacterium]|nr:UDP-3-O-(3-hydroxymyristoyl)glucosamine N-acyltransferase [Planctomycetota bacterium]